MFRQFSRQSRIINNFNLFVDAAYNAGIKTELLKLNENGSCNGLVYAYKMYAHQGQRKEYVLSLMFIASLTRKTTINRWLNKYQEAESKGEELVITINESYISFNKIISMLQGIYFSQNNQTLKEIGVLWDKTCTFLCPKEELHSHLSRIRLRENESVFMELGEHIFYLEKARDGYYLFEPNCIDSMAIYPKLHKADDIAKKILQNTASFITDNNYVAFSMCFVSYSRYTNPLLENAVSDYGDEQIEKHPEIKSIIFDYRQKKLSRLDCALAIQDILYGEESDCEELVPFKKSIEKYIATEQLFINQQTHFNRNNINETVYTWNSSLLGLAVKLNQIIFVRELLNRPDIIVNQATQSGFTPLYIAAAKGLYQITHLLLNRPDIIVNQECHDGSTSLYIATQQGYLRIVQLLLMHPDINVNQARANGVTPLYIASARGFLDIAQMLLTHPDITINQTAGDGSTPLYIASQQGHGHMVNLLIANGGSINIEINASIFMLTQHAKECGRLIHLEQLLKEKNEGYIPDLLQGFTPLQAAIFFGHETVVKSLLAAGAAVQTVAVDKISCLELAEAMDRKKIQKMIRLHLSQINNDTTPTHGVRALS